MPVQYKFFVVPIKDSVEVESDLNRFIRSKRVLTVHREFVCQGENSFWVMAVEYLSHNDKKENKEIRKGRIDYKEILPPEAFSMFVKLREWRKEIAAQEAIPLYTIFTNDQLAEIAKKRIESKSDLHRIAGIGDARVKKYGDDIIRVLTEDSAKITEGTP